MKAACLTDFGTPPRLELCDLPDLTPKPGQILVDIVAASVNVVDTKIAAGMRDIAPQVPGPLGCDFSGIVRKVGAGVDRFEKGDRVFGCAGGVRGQTGAHATQIVADANLVAHAPRSISLRDAAALPLVGITAVEALSDRLNIKGGDHVLIHGGAGGVGHIAVQYAAAKGARVATTVSSERKADLVQTLGAHDVIFYRCEAEKDYVARLTGGRGFDAVFDATGGNDLETSFRAARPMGQVAAIVSLFQADLSTVHMRGLSFHVVFMLLPMLTGEGRCRHAENLRELANLVDQQKIRPLIDPAVFRLADTADAYRHLSGGMAHGKVLIDMGLS